MPVHSTAIVDSSARVAGSADIGPYAIIEGDVVIGENVRVYPHAFIGRWTTIGDRCVIHPGAIVGHLPQDFHYKEAPTYCRIGAGTVIREYVSIHRGTQPESTTVVGEDCFLLAFSHIGHNCELGDRVTMINSATLAGHVTVGDNVILSAHAMAHQFVRIGEFAMIGAGSKIVKDVPPYMKAISYSYCVGSNAIGLRRSGKFSREEIAEARLAYKTMFRERIPFSKALEAFRPMVQTRVGRNILEFVTGPSRFGIAGGAPKGSGEFASGDDEGDEE